MRRLSVFTGMGAANCVHPTNAMEKLAESLAENRKRLAQTLRWPENIGFEMREVSIDPQTTGLLVWVDGLTSTDTLPNRTESTSDFAFAVKRLLAGWTLLLVDGRSSAVLLETQLREQSLATRRSVQGSGELFSRDLRANVALLRRRLQYADLLALPVPGSEQQAGGAALVYRKGKADPALVRAIRRWASANVHEEAAALGTLNRASAVYGLIPRFSVTPWADKAAAMVNAGYVVLLVDRIENGYTAPVTLADWMASPADHGLILPFRRWLLTGRLGVALAVMLLPGAAVSLMNYHVDMIPTAFLLAVGSARESAPFGIIFEVLLLELMSDVARGASSLLPFPLPAGMVIIAIALITLTAVQTGFVGPLPALAAVVGALISLTIPSTFVGYLVRLWRYLFIMAGAILGFFGMATAFAMFISYLCRAKTWGIPFIGPSGSHLTAPEADSSRRPQAKGGKRAGTDKALLR